MEPINSLAYLATTGGTVALVTVVTQYIKSMLPEWLSIRLFVLLACLLVQVGLALVLTPQLEPVLLAFANSFVAASACYGAYEVAFNRDDDDE